MKRATPILLLLFGGLIFALGYTKSLEPDSVFAGVGLANTIKSQGMMMLGGVVAAIGGVWTAALLIRKKPPRE